MNKLPQGWAWSTLQTACTVVRGITFPATAKEPESTDTNVCCLRTSNIQRQIEWKDVYYVSRSYVKREDQLVQQGDVLMSMANSYELVGKVAKVLHVLSPTAFGAFLSAVRPTQAVNGDYLFHFLRTEQVQNELREGSSQTTNIANISVGRLESIAIPLAPSAEQTRIANQLDTLLTRIQSCNDRFDAIPALLKRFRQTVLDASLSGDFGETGVEADAQKVAISSIASVGTGSTPLRSNSQFFANIGTPWVTSSATADAVILRASEYVTPAAISAHRLKVYPKGTLLIAMYGEGKTRGQVAELGIDATINQACAAVVVDNKKALSAFVKLALQANYLNMRELAEGGNQPNLNLSKVKEFEIPLPSLEEQAEIVRRVEALFALADRIEARATVARAHVQRLSPLVLAKAFRGELVPQDPSDEPASVLLARIAAAGGAPSAGRSTRGRKPKKAPHA
jgi:type I restriction enzyme S subunit